MKKNRASQSAFFNPRLVISSAFCSIGFILALVALAISPGAVSQVQAARHDQAGARNFSVVPFGAATSTRQLIISEFRVRGPNPNQESNEYVELYNASGAQLTVQSADGSAGLAVAASDGVVRCVVPNGTVIPIAGHFLCTNSTGYALGTYPSGTGTTATGDQSFALEIPDQAGIALFNNATGGASFSLENRLDAVGPTSEANVLYREGDGLPALTPFPIDSAWVRRLPGGCVTGLLSVTCATVDALTNTAGPTSTQPQDTDDNAADFIFVDTQGTSAGGGQRLGAPGPQNMAAPRSLDGVLTNVTALDICAAETDAPNYVRDLTPDGANNSLFGTIDIRKTFSNSSGAPITRLRFRIIELTTFPAFAGMADLRPRNSNDVVVTVDRAPCGSGTSNVTVRGTTLEQPPAQPNGGGYNSSMAVTTIDNATPLAAGASVDVHFLLGVQQDGVARFCVASETEPASASQVSCFISPPSGSCATSVLTENFDEVTAPNLPPGWVSTVLNGPSDCTATPGTCMLGTQWATDTATPDTAPNSVFHNDPGCVTDATLDSPIVPISSNVAQVTFRHRYLTESGFDGGVLEISTGGGSFTDILSAGGTFVTGGYSRAISTGFHSPIVGRMAWSGDSGGYITTTVNLPPSLAGQNVQLRFRMTSDCSVASTGWRVDTLSVTDGGCATALNISTRMQVESGDNVLIGGFIVTGASAKNVIIRGLGPSLSPGISDALADPTLQLRGSDGTLIAENDNWLSDASQAAQINALGLAPQNPLEASIAATLQPGTSYTAVLAGKDGGTGVGLVEVYDANSKANAQLANISTRGFVLTGNKVMIGGFILGGTSSTSVVVRGIGPSLAQSGISPALADPTLELRDSNGALLVSNDNWQDDLGQAGQLSSRGLGLQNANESGIFASLPSGSFTAILAGKDGATGIGLVEIYNVH